MHHTMNTPYGEVYLKDIIEWAEVSALGNSYTARDVAIWYYEDGHYWLIIFREVNDQYLYQSKTETYSHYDFSEAQREIGYKGC